MSLAAFNWVGVWNRSAGKSVKFHSRMSYHALGDVGIFHGEYDTGLGARFPDSNTFAGSSAPIKALARTKSAEGR
jgi:hypothetical protein